MEFCDLPTITSVTMQPGWESFHIDEDRVVWVRLANGVEKPIGRLPPSQRTVHIDGGGELL